MKAAAAPLGAPWLWTILCYEDRQPVHGYKVTREPSIAVREELAAGVVQLKPETEAEATSILSSLNCKTARPWRGILPFTHLAREGRMTVTIGRRELLAALGGAAVAWPLAARAQQAKVCRPLAHWSLAISIRSSFGGCFGRGCTIWGMWRGKTFDLSFDRRMDASTGFPNWPPRLVRLKVDIIVTWFTPTAVVARQATREIPIVMAETGDPVGLGLVASLP